MGRPTKLTPEVHAAIVRSLDIGATRKDAAEAAGVTYHTFLNWMERGLKAKSGRYFQFFNSAQRAEANARLKFTSTIARAAADGDWRAAMEYLSRRDKEHWSTRQEVTGADGKDIGMKITDWREEYKKRREAVEETLEEFE